MAKTYYKPSRYKYKITGKKRRKICHKQRSSAKELGINLLILTITLVLALLILEVGFRAVFGPHLRYDYPTDTGWELLPDQEGFSIPNHKFASINSLGFRGTEIDPENEGRRIIMIGDSFTFGVGVQDNETMAAQLQARLSKIKGPHLMKDAEVINLGEPGYGVSQMIAKYRKKGADLEPDTVIMTLIEDDIYRQQSTNDPSFYRKTIARKLLTRSVLATYFKPRIEFLRVFVSGPAEDREKKYHEYLESDKKRILEFREELEGQNVELIIFPYTFDHTQTEFYYEMEQFCDENDIRTVNNIYPLLKAYIDENGNEYLRVEDGGHPSGLQFSLIIPEIIDAFTYEDNESNARNASNEAQQT